MTKNFALEFPEAHYERWRRERSLFLVWTKLSNCVTLVLKYFLSIDSHKICLSCYFLSHSWRVHVSWRSFYEEMVWWGVRNTIADSQHIGLCNGKGVYIDSWLYRKLKKISHHVEDIEKMVVKKLKCYESRKGWSLEAHYERGRCEWSFFSLGTQLSNCVILVRE